MIIRIFSDKILVNFIYSSVCARGVCVCVCVCVCYVRGCVCVFGVRASTLVFVNFF